MKQIHTRLDTAIEKLTDVSSCVNRILAVHEEKIARQEDDIVSNEKEIKEPTKMSVVLKRPKVSIKNFEIDIKISSNKLTKHMIKETLFEAETIVKYSGYINRQKEEIDKIKGLKSDQIENILGYSSKSEIVHKDDMVNLQ